METKKDYKSNQHEVEFFYIIYGSGAKIIFPQFDTIIITFVYHLPLDDID